MSELESLTTRATELSSRVDFWNNAVIVALVVTALAAVAIVVSQRLAFVRAKQLSDAQDHITRVKESEAKVGQDRIRNELAASVAKAKEADARIAEAQRGSAEANERATKAQESLSLAEQHSAEASAKAEGFRLDIAKANERAAEADRLAESERLARMQLEVRLAPRTLSSEQQDRLIVMLAPFSKTDVTVVLFGDTFEIQRIGNIIIACLKKAGWNVGTSVALGGGGSVTGIPIGVRSGSDKRTQEAAITLISALQSMGIGAGPWEFSQMQMPMTSLTGDGPHDAPVKVFIGTKP